MKVWNEWMDQREQAPLDKIFVLIRSKWQETKDWMHDLCLDDDGDSGPACDKNAGDLGHDSHTVQPLVTGDQPVVCLSGYEELDQTASEPPSAPQTQDQLTKPSPRIHSSLPLPGASHSSYAWALEASANGFGTTHASEQPSKHVCECRPDVAPEIGVDPSVAGVGQPMLQQGEKVEVWSRSKQCWFEGVVIEAFPNEIEVDGFRVPRGSYKVHYSENTLKWIWPQQVQELLRPSSGAAGI
jgi:hypothetical protein